MNKPNVGQSKLPVQTLQPISKETLDQQKQKQFRIISLLINRLITIRTADAFERVRLIPFRHLRIRQRMKQVIECVFKRQDYLGKWEAFQNIRRTSLASERRDYQHLKLTLKLQRGTAIRLLTNYMIGKKRQIFQGLLSKLKERGELREHQINSNFRKGLRSMAKIFNRKISDGLFRIKDSRVILGQTKHLRSMYRIVKEIRTQNMRWAFVGMRRQMIKNRQEKVKEEIQQLDQKLGGGEDEELKGLQDKYKQLSDQLEELKKEREEIQAKLDGEVKQAETKNKEMKDHLDHLKSSQEEMKKKIVQIDEELKTPFSIQEIYQLCFENLLWTVSQNTQKTFNRDELLRSLQTPLVPVDLPLDQLKEQNQVLKDLLSEYVLMYGQKKLPVGCKLELPYQYLLKENNVLYKMLMTLLPNAQLLREELIQIRDTYENVEKMVKQCAPK